MEIWWLMLAVVGLALGGVLKGAVGVGAPLIAIPVLSLLYGVPVAVVLFTIPNLISNLWQAFEYRADLLDRKFVFAFTAGGAIGAFLGSILLAVVSGEVLMGALACFVFGYIALRLGRPNWILSRKVADRFVWPVGIVGGMMQGAGGISAPVSLTFLSAMRLERGALISTISVFFGAMAVVQVPTLLALGVMTPALLVYSVLAAVPLFGAMSFGAWLGKRIDAEVFDKLILALLAVVAVKLLYDAVT